MLMSPAVEPSAAGAMSRDATRRRHGFHRILVAEIITETSDTKTLVLDVPADVADLFHYAAGQFCTFRASIDGDDVSRCYSMSSAPAIDDRLAVTVKRVPGGRMSNWLHDHVQPGDHLDVMPPAGTFCERPGTTPMLALCGGSGVTPVFSLAKQIAATSDRAVRVLDANRDAAAVIFSDTLAELSRQHDGRVTIRHHLDVDSGFLTTDDIVEFVGEDVDADVFVCGPPPFMDLVEAGLAMAGVPAERIVIERFTDPTAPPSDTPAERAERSGDAVTVTEQLTIRFKRKRHRMAYVAGDTILDAARRAGLAPPFSCLAGECASCMALVLDGTVDMRANHILTDAEIAEGWVLTCQGVPTSREVSIEYESL
jgi:3-ketosteroid 9alpha-monooxygenase subunit B